MLTLITLSFLTSFDEKAPFVRMSPVFTVFSFIFISSNVRISPLFIKLPFISNFLSVAITPELSRLATEIPSLAINFFVVIVFLEIKELLVNISPVLSVFSTTDIFHTA